MNPPVPPPDDEVFLTTRWTRVLAARGPSTEAGDALRDLCAVYYEPVVGFLRRSHDAESARDHAHAFFEWVLQRDAIAGVDPARGRFRNYLLGALKHFLAHERERSHRLKRGGGLAALPLVEDTDTTAPGLALPDDHQLPPDRVFDRQWALHVLRRALEELELDSRRHGEEHSNFNDLKPFLTGDGGHGGLASLAARRGVNEATLRARLHRLRRQFRQCVRRQIAPTLASGTDLEDEMAALLAALS
ncbi:MAG: sigma-70 family RNA polymerase sigma factor [Verrucomicrobiales bacterium]